MRVLNLNEVAAVSGAGTTVAPVINLNFNLNFFLALFSIFKKKTTTTTTTPADTGTIN